MEGRATTSGKSRLDQPLQHKTVVAIKSQDGDTAYYRVEREKKIGVLLSIYCKGRNIKKSDVTFIHDGVRIQPTKTFIQLGIKDGDEIDAMVHQNGGGYLC
ncbi:hypothetical protein C2S53_006421 [Perilla frutescens var. hirtella]|uniref:Ubiquitin-like domain-containing protein n=1 Tax=Perilla frutescens var. hirtella TaxID=608512 RepID=A0AAD4JF14_PERFH|nr:hypothetical protein C2S53_006421 [Perilla frutescens var. hirtella]